MAALAAGDAVMTTEGERVMLTRQGWSHEQVLYYVEHMQEARYCGECGKVHEPMKVLGRAGDAMNLRRRGDRTMNSYVVIEQDRLKACYRYLNLIRNAAKRRYGFEYVAWLRNGAVGHEPEHPGLSVMGAQAVRLNVAEFKLWERSA